MKKDVGIWIDRERAWINTAGNKAVQELLSGVAPKVRLSGGSRSKSPFGPMNKSDERNLERRHEQQVKQFIQRVIKAVAFAERILIVGPGEMKEFLKKRMGGTSPGAKIIAAVKPADKMTKAQFAALVNTFF